MRKSRYSDEQIVRILKKLDAEQALGIQVLRENGAKQW